MIGARSWMCALVGVVVSTAAASDGLMMTDAEGDAALRRTDSGLDGPVPSMLPDLLAAAVYPWAPDAPAVDPWTGDIVDDEDADLFRIDITFAGRLNPPGPIGLGGQPFDPLRFGAHPVYGYLELDLDHDARTGGECSGAGLRYTANAARFGSLPSSPYDDRCARLGDDVDTSYNTEPRIEVTGAEFTLALCGCHAITVMSESDVTDGIFAPGETWIVRSRFFQRAGGFESASAAFGGSFFGHYDPWVDLRFHHDTGLDQTTVSLVFPLNMEGAAQLAGTPAQPIDLDVSNHVSIVEALDDIIIGASFPPPGCGGDLVEEWDGDNPYDHLDPEDWRMIAIFGVPYTAPETTLYAWTDVGFNDLPGDFDGNGHIELYDRDAFDAALAALDGSASDADQTADGVYTLNDPGPDFSLYDVDANGKVDSADRPVIEIPDGDVDGDCAVDFTDLNALLAHWSQTPASRSDGDLNSDNAVDFADLNLLLAHWGETCD